LTPRIVFLASLLTLLSGNLDATDKCQQTVEMQVYSSAFVHEETGDLLGYDLALKLDTDSQVHALLFVYEGGESDEGIPLSGRISRTNLSIQGEWVEHLIEYPSKKNIVQKHLVKIEGVLDPAVFQGKLTIEGIEDQQTIRLKRRKAIWSCRK
jgi:hypothetical protein